MYRLPRKIRSSPCRECILTYVSDLKQFLDEDKAFQNELDRSLHAALKKLAKHEPKTVKHTTQSPDFGHKRASTSVTR
jgi:hypothetical protein